MSSQEEVESYQDFFESIRDIELFFKTRQGGWQKYWVCSWSIPIHSVINSIYLYTSDGHELAELNWAVVNIVFHKSEQVISRHI